MKDFYANFLKSDQWENSETKKDYTIWKKIINVSTNKILIIKKISVRNWVMTIIVENF